MKVFTTFEADDGQTTVALAGVLVVAILLISGLATLAGAIVHRQRAQTAADAVALAGVTDPVAADVLAGWYGERGVDVEHGAGEAIASSGPATAVAWASVETDVQDLALPALVAIVARAEQLTGERLVSARVISDRIEVDAADAATLRLVARELGLCEDRSADAGVTAFHLGCD